MNKEDIDALIGTVREHDVWQQDFTDLNDVLEKALMKIDAIPQAPKAMINLNLTADLIMQKANTHLKYFDLSIPQKNVLEALFYTQKCLTQAQLSKFVFSSKSNISTLLSRMEEKQFIKRIENPKNKREKLIQITKKGETKLKELMYATIKVKGTLVEIITEEEAKELNRILFKIKERFKKF